MSTLDTNNCVWHSQLCFTASLSTVFVSLLALFVSHCLSDSLYICFFLPHSLCVSVFLSVCPSISLFLPDCPPLSACISLTSLLSISSSFLFAFYLHLSISYVDWFLSHYYITYLIIVLIHTSTYPNRNWLYYNTFLHRFWYSVRLLSFLALSSSLLLLL